MVALSAFALFTDIVAGTKIWITFVFEQPQAVPQHGGVKFLKESSNIAQHSFRFSFFLDGCRLSVKFFMSIVLHGGEESSLSLSGEGDFNGRGCHGEHSHNDESLHVYIYSVREFGASSSAAVDRSSGSMISAAAFIHGHE